MLNESSALEVHATAGNSARTSARTSTRGRASDSAKLDMRSMGFKIILAITLLWFALLLTGPYWYGVDPYAMDIKLSFAAPSIEHPLGCDRLGRDLLARMLHGAWTTLALAVVIIVISLVVGTVLGLWAALKQGILARVISALMNALLSFPQQLAVIFVVGVLGVGLWHSIMALCLFWWIHFARICYCRAVSILKEEYIRQARLSGESTLSLVRYYLLPELKGQLLLTALLDVSAAILTLATLSFLGLSTQPPQPEWGSMLFEHRAYLQNAPHLLLYPALFIFISAFLCNLLARILPQSKSKR